MALFSSSEDWNLLTLTLLSALIHPVYKAASMPQFELQANIMATSKHRATTSVLVILSSPERICSRIRQEDGQGMKWKTLQCNHSRFMKDFWKVNSHVAENYIENVLKCRFVFFALLEFFYAHAWPARVFFLLFCSHTKTIVHKAWKTLKKTPNCSQIPDPSQPVC